jgi:hypothetical protein
MKTILLAFSLFLAPAVAILVAQEKTAEKPVEKIDFTRAKELLQKRNSGGKLTDDEAAYLEKAQAARKAGDRPTRQDVKRSAPKIGGEKVGFKPLTEMTADDRYQGQDGGLYGGGQNSPPDEHRKASEAQIAKLQPLDADGKPALDGKIVFISISMSNATQEFSKFKEIADADADKSALVKIVDCAQGGQAMAEWVDPEARPWQVALQRISAAGVTPQQVQVAWIKLANKGPTGSLENHGKKLESDTESVIHNAKAKFPNLRIAYLSSRIYGGYGGSGLNPEPYAYEGAFVCRWLIQRQIKGDTALNYDAARGPAKSPLLLWGPYLWADGVTPRASDKLVYTRDDLGPDGTHPSQQGREKIANLILTFYKTDPLAKPWFAK